MNAEFPELTIRRLELLRATVSGVNCVQSRPATRLVANRAVCLACVAHARLDYNIQEQRAMVARMQRSR